MGDSQLAEKQRDLTSAHMSAVKRREEWPVFLGHRAGLIGKP